MNKYDICYAVFDRYGEQYIKDHEHRRRQKGKVAADIVVSETSKAYKQQELFFANSKNKTQFIGLLTKHFLTIGHCVKIWNADADALIAS